MFAEFGENYKRRELSIFHRPQVMNNTDVLKGKAVTSLWHSK
jgi:hypothetical protein